MDDEYIELKDIKKDKMKSNIKGGFSKLGSVLKKGVTGVHTSLSNAGQRYKQFKAEAPQRREANLLKREQRIKDLSLRMRELKQTEKLRNLESRYRERRMSSIPSMPSMMSMPMGQMMGIPKERPEKRRKNRGR